MCLFVVYGRVFDISIWMLGRRPDRQKVHGEHYLLGLPFESAIGDINTFSVCSFVAGCGQSY